MVWQEEKGQNVHNDFSVYICESLQASAVFEFVENVLACVKTLNLNLSDRKWNVLGYRCGFCDEADNIPYSPSSFRLALKIPSLSARVRRNVGSANQNDYMYQYGLMISLIQQMERKPFKVFKIRISD